jgi:hypothetical protein
MRCSYVSVARFVIRILSLLHSVQASWSFFNPDIRFKLAVCIGKSFDYSSANVLKESNRDSLRANYRLGAEAAEVKRMTTNKTKFEIIYTSK